MSSRLRLPTLALAALSIGLNLAILGTAARSLAVYNAQKDSNPYFLPVWNQHFDTRELAALIGTSTAIFLLNIALVAGMVTYINLLSTASTALSFLLSLLALIFSSVLQTSHPAHRDTLQSWTCRWRTYNLDSVPRQYDTLCHETRFAYYTTIPSFIIQLALLSLAVYGMKSATPKSRGVGGVRFGDEEKAHELGSVRMQNSFDTRLGTPKSMNDSVRYLGGGAKA